MALTSENGFVWPWQYKFPPFFTLQPNIETRRKQINAWCQLLIDYFQSKKQFSLSVASIRDPSCPLFNNANIQRSASSDLVSLVLDELCRRGNLEWVDRSHNNARIIWRTSEEWADLISKWARSTGHGNSVCTFYELTDGDDTRQEAFHGLDISVLINALTVLQKRGKAEIMGDTGVKFFC
ncbi:unnamed protein product [Heterobilharzia americana]|nr:unnamed protein product [Heterobilharzia americana]CAH8434537.1 unnamed protein product [Heterobilharzia americana]